MPHLAFGSAPPVSGSCKGSGYQLYQGSRMAAAAESKPRRAAHLGPHLTKLLEPAVINRAVDAEGLETATSMAQAECEFKCCVAMAPYELQAEVRLRSLLAPQRLVETAPAAFESPSRLISRVHLHVHVLSHSAVSAKDSVRCRKEPQALARIAPPVPVTGSDEAVVCIQGHGQLSSLASLLVISLSGPAPEAANRSQRAEAACW
jgi:hypothetical protein